MVRECSLYDISYLKNVLKLLLCGSVYDQYLQMFHMTLRNMYSLIIECGVLHMSIRPRVFIVLFKTYIYFFIHWEMYTEI